MAPNPINQEGFDGRLFRGHRCLSLKYNTQPAKVARGPPNLALRAPHWARRTHLRWPRLPRPPHPLWSWGLTREWTPGCAQGTMMKRTGTSKKSTGRNCAAQRQRVCLILCDVCDSLKFTFLFSIWGHIPAELDPETRSNGSGLKNGAERYQH